MISLFTIQTTIGTIIGLFLGCGSVIAQQLSAPNSLPSSQPTTGTLEVRVAHAITGEPVEDASVIVRIGRRTISTVKTPKNGIVRIAELAAGAYSVLASKRNYGAAQRPKHFIQLVNFGPGYQGTQSIELYLLPPGEIQGRIAQEDGKPIPAMRIQLLKRMIEQGQGRFRSVSTSRTGEDGRFEFLAVAPGEYHIAAIPKDASLSVLSTLESEEAGVPIISDVTTYFGGTTHLEGSAPILVKPGQTQQGLTISLRRDSTFCLEIPLSDPSAWHASSDLILKITRTEKDYRMTTLLSTLAPAQLINKAALRVCNLPRGNYEINAHVVDKVTGDFWYHRGLHFLSETSQRSSAIALTQPAKRFHFELVPANDSEKVSLAGISIFIEPLDRDAFMRETFEFSLSPGKSEPFSLIPGAYLMRIGGAFQNRSVLSIEADGQDLRRNPMQTDRSYSGVIRIAIMSGASQINGSVTDEHGQSVNFGTIVALAAAGPSQMHPALFSVGRIAEDGTFSFAGLSPQDYSLVCVLGLDHVEGTTQEVIDQRWESRQTITIDGKQNKQIAFKSDGTACR